MFGSTYRHHLEVFGSATGGSQNADGGWNPGQSGMPVYDDKCDAQEPNQGGGLKVTTGETKVETQTADLRIFLKDESKIHDLAIGMKGELTRGSQKDRIVITMVRIIDGMIKANTI